MHQWTIRIVVVMAGLEMIHLLLTGEWVALTFQIDRQIGRVVRVVVIVVGGRGCCNRQQRVDRIAVLIVAAAVVVVVVCVKLILLIHKL